MHETEIFLMFMLTFIRVKNDIFWSGINVRAILLYPLSKWKRKEEGKILLGNRDGEMTKQFRVYSVLGNNLSLNIRIHGEWLASSYNYSSRGMRYPWYLAAPVLIYTYIHTNIPTWLKYLNEVNYMNEPNKF